MTTPTESRLAELLAQLTLEEKVALVSGASFWTTTPIEKIGLRAMVLSDGPSGVRGPEWDERDPSLNLPSATALAASWDPALAYRYGVASASEARRKGVDVVLGPTINLHRSPLGGRHFEAFSEDPELTAELGAAYVRGLQDNGVAATPKHYIANDSETDRFTVNVIVDERTLRELYLLPFERAVQAGAWAIMSSYNSVDGVTLTENELLETPLNSEWGFDGIVVSDWTAVRDVVSANASQDLAMPGPAPAWSEALVAAVRSGEVPESAVDRKVLRMLALAERVGALEGTTAKTPEPIDGVAFVRAAAVEGTVLLRNEGELPLTAPALSRVAVIGHNARDARTQGGGSATVVPERIVSPLEGIRTALPHAEVSYEVGAIVQEGVAELPLATLINPSTGDAGLLVTFFDADDQVLFEENRRATALFWLGGNAPVGSARRVRLTTTYTPDESAELKFGFATGRPGTLWLDGEKVIETPGYQGPPDLGAALLAPPSVTVPFSAIAGTPVEVVLDLGVIPGDGALDGVLSVTLGTAPDDSDQDALLARAVESARAAEVAVVVVGTNSVVESEGYDRSNLDLPGRQDELVRAVAAVNPRTIVIVNAGAPVLLPWRDEVSAIVLGYFGGQEFGSAIADVVFGAAEPGGRLTTTWPAAFTDVPVLNVTPSDGELSYDEGIHIGYRAWLKAGTEPAYPFGAGLGYTSWQLGEPRVSGSLTEGTLSVQLSASNTGERAGKQVVQVYAERTDSTVDRPVRWLVGFAVARADTGGSVDLTIPVTARSLSYWNSGWVLEPGSYTLRVGTSVVDLPFSVEATA